MGRPPSYDHTMLLREIIDCLWERGYAATPISVALAEKLGYHFSHAYPCLEIAVPTQKEDLG